MTENIDANSTIYLVIDSNRVFKRDGKLAVRQDSIYDKNIPTGFSFVNAAEAFTKADTNGFHVYEVKGIFPENTIFQVTENSDQTEGRGHQVKVGLFSNFVAAFDVAKGRGGMGHGFGTIEILANQTHKVFASKRDFLDNRADANVRNTNETLLNYWGLNNDYFTINADLTEEKRAIDDPDYAEYMRLKVKYDS